MGNIDISPPGPTPWAQHLALLWGAINLPNFSPHLICLFKENKLLLIRN